VILCSGKIFYALQRARQTGGLENQVVLIRVEQLYPFPTTGLLALIDSYPSADLVWCQEEAENQGSWHFVQRWLATGSRPLHFAGRRAMPVSAGGSVERHDREEATLLAQALDVPVSVLAQEQDAVV
jgi:2-oxoglutarate dehydrogenase E1 component